MFATPSEGKCCLELGGNLKRSWRNRLMLLRHPDGHLDNVFSKPASGA